MPRIVLSSVFVVAAFVAGALAAWYETWVLLGALDVGAVLIGIVLGALFLLFVIAVVAVAAGRANSVLGTVMSSIVVLLVMPLLGLAEAIGRWLPTHLGGALGALTSGELGPGDYVPAASVTVAAIAVLLWAAVRLAERREL